jgi:hypothetical protein
VKLRVLLLVLVLISTLQAATKPGNEFSGAWKFVAAKSNGGEHFPPDTMLVIKQFGSRVYFEYWANHHLFQNEQFRTDSKAEKAYTSPNETAMISAHFGKKALTITTQHLMENEIGSQGYSESDRWTVSEDGKVLTAKLATGKTITFERATPDEAKSATTRAPQ